MNKSSKIFLSIIIILLVILAVMTVLYLKMRNTAKENLNQVLETAEENMKLNARISELEAKSNIASITNATVPYQGNIDTDFVNNTKNEISGQIDYSIDIGKVTIEVDKNTITPTSVSIVITNNNENILSYGEEFKIQKKINGNWKDLEYLPNTIWNAMAYITQGNSQTTKKLNLKYTYGELSKGIYRVVKPVFGNNGVVNIYSNEFEIK